MSKDKLPAAKTISGTLDELCKKYKAELEDASNALRELEALSEDLKKAPETLGRPEAKSVAGRLDALAKKYKNATFPQAETIAGSLDALCKKYKDQ